MMLARGNERERRRAKPSDLYLIFREATIKAISEAPAQVIEEYNFVDVIIGCELEYLLRNCPRPLEVVERIGGLVLFDPAII